MTILKSTIPGRLSNSVDVIADIDIVSRTIASEILATMVDDDVDLPEHVQGALFRSIRRGMLWGMESATETIEQLHLDGEL